MNLMSERDAPFCSMVRASGQGEVWTHTHDELKFTQFGWRSTTQEEGYRSKTLVGNWNEHHFDVEHQRVPKRLPSQYEHYFDTTYGSTLSTKPAGVPESLKHLAEREPIGFPGSQPELDPPLLKNEYNSFQTTSRAAYVDPRVRKEPVVPPENATQGVNNSPSKK
ncbi:cilia- and flagella-associated protein 68-like [Branchiostoma lanceolatum]|uniref:cilia- and flagella-associated protein 68-like n=1 Tax=Branchiostoma lanceolatum TaxID=7740 RepID=UPI001132DF63